MGPLAYTAFAAANVAGHVAGATPLARATKPLLMPALVGWLLDGTPRTRLVRLATLALVLSWFGDLALMRAGQRWFLAGMAAFGAAQAAYTTAFWPLARRLLRARPLCVVPYAAAWVAAVGLLGPRLGDLAVPVAVYGALLLAMAASATGVHALTAAGAVLFVASDLLIAATGPAGHHVPGSEALVMATYTAAQALIVAGVRRASTASTATGTSSAPAPSVSAG